MPPPGAGRRDFPYWLLVVGLGAAWLLWAFLTDEVYARILGTLAGGIVVTAYVTAVAFLLASALGLALALCALSRFLLLRQAARLYVEIVRGVPMLVLLLYIATHGSSDHTLLVDMDPIPLDQIDPDGLVDILSKQPFRWKVVVVNACYSGGFVPKLRGTGTLVLTAARSDRTSFGCGAKT